MNKYLESIRFVAVVTPVIKSVDVMVPLKMRSRLIQHLTKLTKRDVSHLFIVVMRSVPIIKQIKYCTLRK